MRILIVNMTRSVKRWEYIRREMARAGVSQYERFPAIDGHAMSAEERTSLFDDSRFEKINHLHAQPGEVGCTLSHHAIWQRIAADGQPAVVLEDDVIIQDNFIPDLPKVEEMLAADKPMIILLNDNHYKLNFGNRNDFTVKPIDPWGTYGYALNSAAAKIITNLGRPYYFADSWHLFTKNGISIRALSTPSVRHDYELEETNVYSITWKSWPICLKIKRVPVIFMMRLLFRLKILTRP